MTLNDIKNDVAALGFESEINIDNAFIGATNRALYQIFTEKPSERVMRIHPNIPSPVLFRKEISSRTATGREIKALGKAFAFRSFGQGSVEIVDELGKRVISFEKENELVRGFIKGEASFCFVDGFCYTVYDFSIYSELTSDKIDDVVPYSQTVFFDPKKYDERFIGFSSYPYDDEGRLIEKTVIDSRGLGIKLPFSNAININYRVRPSTVSADLTDTEIDIPTGCEHLLALLVAHYIWLDDDFNKANHYLSLYRDGMNAVKYYSKDHKSARYYTNGWA
jgi:hypothetical protein